MPEACEAPAFSDPPGDSETEEAGSRWCFPVSSLLVPLMAGKMSCPPLQECHVPGSCGVFKMDRHWPGQEWMNVQGTRTV